MLAVANDGQKIENLALRGDLLNLNHGDEGLTAWDPSSESGKKQNEIIQQMLEIQQLEDICEE